MVLTAKTAVAVTLAIQMPAWAGNNVFHRFLLGKNFTVSPKMKQAIKPLVLHPFPCKNEGTSEKRNTMEKKTYISAILKQELILAMGCTEPAACALSGAKASELLIGDKPTSITVETTRDILKNAMGVNIPGVEKKGVCAAVALGVAIRDTSYGLDILSHITEAQKKEADGYQVKLNLVEEDTPLYIKVILSDGKHTSMAVVSQNHDHFSYLEQDGKVLSVDPKEANRKPKKLDIKELTELSMDDIIEYAKHMDNDIEALLLEALSTNMKIAEESLKEPYGLSVGKTLMKDCTYPPKSLSDAFNAGAALAAGGSDARMAGCQLPVMINSGSGNQGITLTVPIAVLGTYLQKTDREKAEALCIAELTALVLTAIKGRLSAQCGAFTAATGLGCGVAWLQGGDGKTMEKVITNMVGDLAGVICDGAKMTCALKIYSCVQSAYLASKLALNGYAPTAECGIIGDDAQNTLKNLAHLTHEGMEPTDKTILSIMVGKQK